MRILITGCNGLLGQNVARLAPSGAWLIGVDRTASAVSADIMEYQNLDIGDKEGVQTYIQSCRPDWIINTAAITNVDFFE